MTLTVRKMEKADLLSVQHLFARVGTQAHSYERDSFIVVENEQGMIVGTVGLDKAGNAGNAGLLRTMVIDSQRTHALAAVEFIQLALAFAQSEGVNQLFALSEGKEALFEPLGFVEVSHSLLPAEIKQLDHFKEVTGKDNTKVWSYAVRL